MGKTCKGMETAFPRCKGNTVQQEVDNISVGPHPVLSQAVSHQLRASFPGTGAVATALFDAEFPRGQGDTAGYGQEEPREDLTPPAAPRPHGVYFDKGKKTHITKTRQCQYSPLGNVLSQ